MNNSNIMFHKEHIPSLIASILIIGLLIYLTVYWFGGQREADNLQDASHRWTQKATVMEKTNYWWGDSCLLNAENGLRYYDDSCSRYINGDRVIIMMYNEHYSWIEGLVK